VANVAQSAYAGALDRTLLIAAIVSFAGAVLATVLIRPRDFAVAQAEPGAPVAVGAPG
jgi:hypothetical protein